MSLLLGDPPQDMATSEGLSCAETGWPNRLYMPQGVGGSMPAPLTPACSCCCVPGCWQLL